MRRLSVAIGVPLNRMGYRPDTEIQYRPREPHGLAKDNAELVSRPEGKPINGRRISVIDPTIVDFWTFFRLRTAIFVDAISALETSFIFFHMFPGFLRRAGSHSVYGH